MTDEQQLSRPALQATIEAIRNIVNIPLQQYSVRKRINAQGENEGMLAILIFAVVCELYISQTLILCGEAYAQCIENPNGTEHPNVRELMDVSIDIPIAEVVQIDTSFLSTNDVQALKEASLQIISDVTALWHYYKCLSQSLG